MLLHVSEPPIMSYAEKPEDITKEEWMDKLNNVHIQRADMNRLIMNYLVTGKLFMYRTAFIKPEFGTTLISCFLAVLDYCQLVYAPCFAFVLRGVQRGGRKVSNGIWNWAQCGPGLPGWKDKDPGDDSEGTDTGSDCTDQQSTPRAPRH